MERRDFLKMLGIAPGAVGAAASVGRAQEKLISHLVPPDPDIPPDQALYRPSVCTECPANCGLTVTVKRGHPIKLEGDPDDPYSRGGLCVRGQASLMRLYHPERLQQPLRRQADGSLTPISWEEALAEIRNALSAARGAGRSSYYLASRTTGALDTLLDEFAESEGVERLPEFEILNHGAIQTANRILFGRETIPAHRMDRADLLVTLGTDLFETFIHPVRFARDYAEAQGRRFEWFHLEPHLSLTGSNASHRLAIKPGSEAALLAYLLVRVTPRRPWPADLRAAIPRVSRDDAVRSTGLAAETLDKLTSALEDRNRRPLVIAGGVATAKEDGLQVALLAGLLQWATGQIGETVDFSGAENYPPPPGGENGLVARADRAAERPAGVVFLSRIHSVDLLPAAGRLMEKAGLAIGISDFNTASLDACDLILPLSHTLESAGDVHPRRGWRVRYSPVFEPLHDTRHEGDILLEIMRRGESFADYLDRRWSRAGAAAGRRILQSETDLPAPDLDAAAAAGRLTRLADSGLTEPALIVTASLRTYDGRSRPITLLHEIPDPVSTVSYGDYLSISPADAERLGLDDGAEVEIGGTRLPVRRQPELPAGVSTLAIDHRGDLQLALAPDTGECIRYLGGVAPTATGGMVALPVLSGGTEAEGRGILPGDAEHGAEHGEGHEDGHDEESRYGKTSLYKPHEHEDYRWGMAIDLDKCTGCSACVAACYIENNVPIVGPEEHLRGREMSWLRIEPYQQEERHKLEFLPMLCQHCDYAPCESVCPVLATYHNPEGLNVQVYNRCVGTRYCSNNCPYKVRRFNWYAHPRPEPLDLLLNPEVSVRPKGVMEKCTFCIQRIREAKDKAKDEGRLVRDGEFTTACAQSCPSQAIVFGSLKDEDSQVSRQAHDERAHRVLEELGTEPAVHYLSEDKRHER
ncbi:MAG: 4Fe-4S dicluster domain-containing protein [Candidatus Eisenbacteria bacterium]|nr:4Fe-4S dicluster domain-containing protein [Candidatus Eisenbacteria bacterium]